uniref:Uncharacterized protein n=1 Tax=Corethron hystrix TaxID=216773 RepID=A0A7S1FUD1_9STRA
MIHNSSCVRFFRRPSTYRCRAEKSMILLVAMFPVLFLLTGAASPSPSSPLVKADDQSWFNEDDDPCVASPAPSLPCYLYSLSIPLPDVEMKSGVVTMTLSDGVCTHFRIGRIRSSEHSSDARPTLSVGADGVGTSCSLRYHVTGGMHGSLVASTSPPDSGLDATLALESEVWDGGRYGVPTSAEVAACDAHLSIPKDGGIKFSGSASAEIMRLFSPLIASSVTKAMNDMLCEEDTLRQMDEYLTAQIGATNDVVEEAIVSARGAVEDPEVGDDAAEWDEWEEWTSFLNNIGSLISRYVNTGIVPVLPSVTSAQQNTDYCACLGQGVVGIILAATGGTGTVALDIPFNITLASIDGYGTAVLSLHSIEVGGLETLAAADFSLSNPRSFIQGLAFDALSVKMNATVLVLDDDDGTSQLRENFEAEYAVSDLRFDMRTVLDYSRTRLGDITVDRFVPIPSQQRPTQKWRQDAISSLPNDDAPPHPLDLLPPVVNWKCFLDPLQQGVVTDLRWNATVSELSLRPPPSADVLEKDLDDLLNRAAETAYAGYPEYARDGIYAALQGPARESANRALEDLLASAAGSCDEDTGEGKHSIGALVKSLLFDEDEDTYFRFDQSWGLAKVRRWLDRYVGPTGKGANDFMKCLSRHLPSPDTSPGGIGLPGSYGKEWEGGSMMLKDVVIMNGDTFYDFDILAPQDSRYRIFSQIGLGGCSDTPACPPDSPPLELSAALEGRLDNLGVSVSVRHRSRLSALLLASGTDLRYDLAVLGELSARQILERPVCLLTPLAHARSYGSRVSVGSHSFETLVRIEGTSGAVDYNFTNWWDGDYDQFLVDAAYQLDKVLGGYWEEIVRETPYLCRGEEPPKIHPTYRPDSNIWQWAYFSLGIIGAGSLVVLFFQQKSSNKDRLYDGDSQMIATESSSLSNIDMDSDGKTTYASNWENDISPHEDGVLTEPLLGPASSATDPDSTSPPLPKSTSLITHPTVPLFSRILLCATILGAIALFTVSNSVVGGSVVARIEGRLPGSDASVHTFSFYDCSLVITVRDMWQAGVYPLSVLILLLSGVWPYVKLLLMLYTFVAPLEICSRERRESIMMWLDMLGKYSLLDVYVLVVTMVAFFYHFDFGEWGKTDIYVAPKPGFFCFLTATIVSLIVGHIILFLHRRSITHQKNPTRAHEGRSAMCNHFFVQHKVCLTSLSKFLVLASFLFLAVLLSFGVLQECFQFKLGGAAALVLEDRAFSLISLGLAIPSIDEHKTGLMVIKVTYFMFALVMPFLCLLLLFVCFFVPLRPKTQQLAFFLAEMANAWAALEVFVFSMFAALLQLEQFAQFLVGDYCDAIDPILEKVLDDQIDGEDVCFSVKAQILGNSWSLVLGAVLYGFLSSFLLKFLHLVLEENIHGCPEEEESKRAASTMSSTDGTFHNDEENNVRLEGVEGKSSNFVLRAVLRSDWFVSNYPNGLDRTDTFRGTRFSREETSIGSIS